MNEEDRKLCEQLEGDCRKISIPFLRESFLRKKLREAKTFNFCIKIFYLDAYPNGCFKGAGFYYTEFSTEILTNALKLAVNFEECMKLFEESQDYEVSQKTLKKAMGFAKNFEEYQEIYDRNKDDKYWIRYEILENMLKVANDRHQTIRTANYCRGSALEAVAEEKLERF